MIIRLALGGVLAVLGLGVLASGLSTGEPVQLLGGLACTFLGLFIAVWRGR